MTHVPYESTAPALVDLLRGHVQRMFAGPIALGSHIRNCRLRALAIADRRRMPVLPEVPTMAEAGFPGVETGTRYGLVAPARTPPAIAQTLHGARASVLQRPDVKARLAGERVEILGQGPDEFARQIITEITKYAAVVRSAGLKVD